MKFAKEIEDDLVPEWRAKYFDYKTGKKKIKAVTRAVRAVQKTPGSSKLRPDNPRSATSSSQTPILGSAFGYGSFWKSQPSQGQQKRGSSSEEEDGDEVGGLLPVQSYRSQSNVPQLHLPRPADRSQPIMVTGAGDNSASGDSRYVRYGSIVGSPPSPLRSGADSLRLPGPALDPDAQGTGTVKKTADGDRHTIMPRHRPSRRSAPAETPRGTAFEVGKTKHAPNGPFRHVSFSARHLKLGPRSKSVQNVNSDRERPLLRRIFSPKPNSTMSTESDDVPLEAMKMIDVMQAQFFDFLDKELEKVNSFYDSKEQEASDRLNVLRDQLHVMRDQRLEEIVEAQRRKEYRDSRGHSNLEGVEEFNRSSADIVANPAHILDLPHGMDVVYHPMQAAREMRWSRQPRHQNTLATPPTSAIPDHQRDYTRRPERPDVPYLTAKRKLKAALQEYYRGLELLKAYALLNRTAFRKINKKYDKAVHARPTGRYMHERVDEAHFVKSSVLDGHITTVEDLYARYFEKGNHKIAVNKLRKKNSKVGSYTGSVFRNGLLAAAGLVFGIEGIVYGGELLYTNDPVLVTNTSYLLQIYAGYLLLLYLVIFFCVDCLIFNKAKVNYSFIFEFDTRHNLDWRQLSEIPCFCLFLLGISLWLNFSRVGGDTMYLYYPVILIGLTTLLLFAPVPYFYHKSRQWFLYSCWRLLFAGAYPVEFRDFFLGDMFCSQTYAMGNLELFFCLYAHYWRNPAQCNSSTSRLLGFFTCLPGIWRALQCIRRYYDTRNVFPHLVNCGKYGATILATMSLSMYRIDKTDNLRAVFITFSTVNSIYTSIWDLLMDWSLLDPHAPHPYLRENLAYSYTWAYYAAMVLDPILRFNWIFYAIFFHEVQHSAILSFLIGLSEITRRGIWVIFRVENEHCTNVGRFRASRDIPLPYKVPKSESEDHLNAEEEAVADEERHQHEVALDAIATSGGIVPLSSTLGSHPSRAGVSSSADLESGRRAPGSASASPAVQSLRRRQQPSGEPSTPSMRERIGTLLRGAHAQDFERRRKDDEDEGSGITGISRTGDDDDDDDDDAEEHAQDLETGGDGMDVEDTQEVGRRLSSPRTPHTPGQRWRELAAGVREAGQNQGGFSAVVEDAVATHSPERAREDEDVSPDEGSSNSDEYNTIEDRRDILGAEALMRAARAGTPDEEDD